MKLSFKPFEWQEYCQSMMKKYNVWVVHRGAGKSYLIQHILAAACLDRVGDYLYICPQLKQARRIIWDGPKGIKALLRPLAEATDENGKPLNLVTFNEQYTTIQFWNGSRLMVLGAEDPENLRGVHPRGYVIDETQGISKEALDVLKGANANDPWKIYIGTPKSKNILYQLFTRNQGKDDWCCIKLDVYQTKRKTLEEIDALRREDIEDHGNDAFFRQEFLCDFEAAVSGAYYATQMQKASDEGRIREVMYDPAFPVHTAWDLGRDCNAIWFFQLVNEQIRVIDYLEQPLNNGLPETIQEVKAKGYVFGSHIGPHDVNQHTVTGQTKGDIAAIHGIYFDVIDPKLSVDEGIDTVRRTLPRCVFDEQKCHVGIESLKQYAPSINKDGVITRPKHDRYSHGADAFRYLAVNVNEISNDALQPRTPEALWKTDSKPDWDIW